MEAEARYTYVGAGVLALVAALVAGMLWLARIGDDAAYATVAATEEKLHRLKDTPVLLLWGMKDFVFDHHFLDRFVELVPHAEVQRWPDAGHYVLEDAADEVVPRIVDFLSV